MAFKENMSNFFNSETFNCFSRLDDSGGRVDKDIVETDGYTPNNDYRISRVSRASRVSTMGGNKRNSLFGGGKENDAGLGINGQPVGNLNAGNKRASVAVIECPLPNLAPRNSGGNVTSAIDLCREARSASDMRRSHGGGHSVVLHGHSSVTGQHPSVGIRPSLNIPIGGGIDNALSTVDALEICPASPEREKLVEIYVINEGNINRPDLTDKAENKANLAYLKKFFQEVERDAVVLLAQSNDAKVDEELLKELRVKYNFKENSINSMFSFGKKVNCVGLAEGDNYLSQAVGVLHDVRQRNRNNENALCTKGLVNIAMTNCSSQHCKNLIEDINGIHLLIKTGVQEQNEILKPRGVPIIGLDTKSIGHITIGFDDYDQYEIRRSECINYYEYLKELGLLDFLEDSEEEQENATEEHW